MFDLWDHQFCLTCDKQVNIEGAAYCSESCRLSDFEKTCSTSSSASSPTYAPNSNASSFSPNSNLNPSKFYLSPAYDFTNAQPYGNTRAEQLFFGQRNVSIPLEAASSSARQLSQSSSHSSLCSIQSTSSTEANQLSDKAKQELRAYAVSFEQVRMQRRRSY